MFIKEGKLNMLKKKGVSPLIATVIVVSLVVASTTIFMIWGKKYAEDIQKKQGSLSLSSLECTGISISANPSSGMVDVMNDGSAIDGVIIRSTGSGGKSNSVLYEQKIDSGDSRSYPFSNIPGVSKVETVDVIPAIGKGIYRPCSDQRVELKI